jgi:hypothetical protein
MGARALKVRSVTLGTLDSKARIGPSVPGTRAHQRPSGPVDGLPTDFPAGAGRPGARPSALGTASGGPATARQLANLLVR